jgi:hypothetical protein
MILNLISGPRNVSTALMYSFAQRSDTAVVDEPFYAVYLTRSGVVHPGKEDVLKALSADEELVKEQLTLPREKPVLFVKNMAHHMEVLDDPFIAGATNIFLIREPRHILASYAEVIARPVMRDIGIAYQYDLFQTLLARGEEPLVIESHFLLKDPVRVLTEVCSRCGLPFEQRMAHWPRGPKPYDGVWARHWYGNVHNSKGFEKQTTNSRPFPAHLHNLCAEAQSFYEKLLPFSIKA